MRGLETDIDLSWVDISALSEKICVGTIASADHDLDPEHRDVLRKAGVLAADWESASIALICKLNGVRCLIIRGVSDTPAEPETQAEDFHRNTEIIMNELFGIADKIIPSS